MVQVLAQTLLAGGLVLVQAVRATVDHEATGATNTFAAIRCECERLLALLAEPEVDVIQELEDGHLRYGVLNSDGLEVSLGVRVGLTPDFKSEFHYL